MMFSSPHSFHSTGIACRRILLAIWLGAATASHAEELTPTTQLLLAQDLETSGIPVCAGVELLAAEYDYEIDGETASAGLQWLRDYSQLIYFKRAELISQLWLDAWDKEQHNEFWLQQARHMLYRGEQSNVEHALNRLRKPLNKQSNRARLSLLGLVRLQQRRFAEAVIVLEERIDEGASSTFDQYNLALALLGQSGQKVRGLKLLDDLSQLPFDDAEGLALRDRINLTLGWTWLSAQKGGTARPYFRRVRLDSPDAGMALLGMGWAELVSNGRQQFAPVFMGFYHEFPFEPASRGAQRFRRAIKPWQELKEYAFYEPAAQEALQAIAFAYARLDETGTAISAYRQVIKRYRAEIARLEAMDNKLMRPINDPRHILERHAHPGEFKPVIASQMHASIVSDIDDLQSCGNTLEEIRAAAEPYQRDLLLHLDQLDADFHQARQVLLDELRQQYRGNISLRRRQLESYLASASFSLARIQDLGSSN